MGFMVLLVTPGQSESKEEPVSASSTKEQNRVSHSHPFYSLPATWNETADQILIFDRAVEWTRHLKNQLGLPSWIDLGLEQRTRFESLSFPFRQGESGTQAQIPQRSRIRLGIDGLGPLRIVIRRVRILVRTSWLGKPLSLTAVWSMSGVSCNSLHQSHCQTFMGPGLRADGHFGRITMDAK